MYRQCFTTCIVCVHIISCHFDCNKYRRCISKIISKHAWESGHDIDWDSCKIINKKTGWKKRKHLESFYFSQRQPCLNKDKIKRRFLTITQHYSIQRNIKQMYGLVFAESCLHATLYIALHSTLHICHFTDDELG